MLSKVKYLTLGMSAIMLVGCASTPQLYPNAKYKQVGKVVAQKDIDLCTKEADAYLKSPKAKKILKGAGAGAAVGGAVGLVSGLISGDWAGSALGGAAVGAAAGGVAGSLSPDELKQRYVNKCLADKGYQVLGWS